MNDYIKKKTTMLLLSVSIQEPKVNLGVPMDISSPITSDEEYLSPLEEGMDFGGPEPRRSIDTRFRKPPAFLVRLYRNRTVLITN